MKHTNGKPPVEIQLALAAIEPSPHNARKHFDPEEVKDRAETMVLHGVLVPVLVWQPDRRRKHYELIDGEYRWRAAKLAGLATIPAKVHDVDAQGARELSLICNIQRKDLTTLELADGYAELIAEHGHTADTLAVRMGKSADTVRHLVKVSGQLCALGRDALNRGRIPLRVALLLARIPGAEAQEEATRFVLAGWTDGPTPTPADVKHQEEDGRAPLNVAQTQELIREHYCRELKQAPFSRGDPDLLPAAGSCDACPKRTGNQRTEWPDSRGDICTDPVCFNAKVQAHGQQLLDRHREAGRVPLPKAEAQQLFTQYHPTTLSVEGRDKYVDLKEQCDEVPGGRSWKELVGEQCAGEIIPVLDGKQQPHELVPRESAYRVLRHDHADEMPKPARRSSGTGNDSATRYQREQAERARDLKLAKAAARKAAGIVAEAMQTMMNRAMTVQGLERLRASVACFAEVCWTDACRQVLLRREAEPDSRRSAGDVEAIAALGSRATSAPELFGLLFELLTARAAQMREERWSAFCRVWGINWKQLLKDASPSSNGAKRKKETADA